MTAETPVLFTGLVCGAIVRYHGSITSHHGDCILVLPSILQTIAGNEMIRFVRRQSYAVVPVPVADIVRKSFWDHTYHWAATADPGRAACGRTRLDDSTAAMPGAASRIYPESHCSRPACARRWDAWNRQQDEAMKAFYDSFRN